MHKSNLSTGTDIAKAIGILLVVTGHVIRGLFNANIVPADSAAWAMADQSIYLFHMPLFFFIAGIFFKDSVLKKGIFELTKRNVYVLLLPLIVWSYLQFGLQYMASGSTNANVTLTDFIYAPIPPKAQFWFLWALFKITIIVGIILAFKKFVPILIIVTCILLILTLIPQATISSIIGMDVAKHLPYFVLGVLGIGKAASGWKINNWWLIAILALIISFNLLVNNSNEILRFLLSTACVLAIFKIALNFSLPPSGEFKTRVYRFILFVGMNSMIIYLAHVICEATFRAILVKLGVYTISVHFIVGVITGLLLPLLLVNISIRLTKYSPKIVPLILPARKHR